MKTFYEFLNEDLENTINLYHGTCIENANNLLKNGWTPNEYPIGSSMGQSKYLYLTSEKDDALWFANEKGCDTVINVINIPIDYLKFDPEDGNADLYNYDILNAINKIENEYKLPIKFVLIKSLTKKHFNKL